MMERSVRVYAWDVEHRLPAAIAVLTTATRVVREVTYNKCFLLSSLLRFIYLSISLPTPDFVHC